ncbi:MAG: fumarylacetoacetate hydrolase family protein [Aquirufa sp.]
MKTYKIYLTSAGIQVQDLQGLVCSVPGNWDEFINQSQLFKHCASLSYQEINMETPLCPIDSQEIWAAGVTYLRSKVARMEESKESGGDTFYDKVYDAQRPEIFYKGNKLRAVGNQGLVRIRKDSAWNVPEPELTLFINKHHQIAGYLIGNDMSSRDILGENPLYLPQAKVYDASAGIGPCLLVADQALAPETGISMRIYRDQQEIFQGATQISQMKRTHTELAEYLTREMSFPHGAYLMTGTCIVPDPPFTLQAHDEIHIQIEPIGTLIQTVQA